MCNMCIVKDCLSEGTVKVNLYKRGGRSAYLCNFHAHNIESYSTKNTTVSGVLKANGFTFGVELETSYSNMKSRVELASAGFIPTADSTVDVEYKSPIFEGLNAPVKICETVGRLIDEGHLKIDDDCGTHFHVGHHEFINEETMNYMRRFYHSLFVPLSDVMKANPEKVETLFGRGFGYWSRAIDNSTSPTEHTNFINLQHNKTVEFRICKFSNSKQYAESMRFCKTVMITVINNFIAHFNDTNYDIKKYPNITAYRKHKAQVTAKKLVKLFEKA